MEAEEEELVTVETLEVWETGVVEDMVMQTERDLVWEYATSGENLEKLCTFEIIKVILFRKIRGQDPLEMPKVT